VAFWLTGQVLSMPAGGRHPAHGPTVSNSGAPVSVSLEELRSRCQCGFVGLVYTGEIQINVLIPANAPTGSAGPAGCHHWRGVFRTDVTAAIQ